jgi:colicin import membrane protein
MPSPLTNHRRSPPLASLRHSNRKALGWAILVHLILLLALILGVDWHSENPGPVQVQLWTKGDEAIPPRPQSQPTPPESAAAPTAAPTPPSSSPPTPSPPAALTPAPEPDIALQKAARKKEEQEEQARQAAAEKAAQEKARQQIALEAEKQHLEKQRHAAAEKAVAEKVAAEKAAVKQAAAKKAAEKKAAEEKAAGEKVAAEKAAAKKTAAKKAAAKKAAAEHALKEAFRHDALGAAGIISGTADRNQLAGGRDNGYGAKVRACIQAGVSYPSPPHSAATNPTVEYRVQLNAMGRVSHVTLTRSSGSSGFDRAVEVGIWRCNPFPKPSMGRYEPIIDVIYRMYD